MRRRRQFEPRNRREKKKNDVRRAGLRQVDVEGIVFPIDLADEAKVDGVLDAAHLGAHASTHQQGGSDPIKLDDLATPDDNTDLNASTTRHGLLRKLDNNPSHFLDGQGNWTDPLTSGGYWTIATNGDGTNPEIEFDSNGDVAAYFKPA